MDESDRPWTCTVVRALGLDIMRRERSWRPIVTVELDKTQQHETILGCDGQNINLKESFLLRDASFSSQVDVKVFYRSQSKKKGKQRNLVGAVSCSLGEMWKSYGQDPKLRLQSKNPTERTVRKRRPSQSGAFICLRLRPPASTISWSERTEEDDCCSSSSSTSNDSETLAPPSIPEEHPQLKKRRLPRRGYIVNSDEEPEPYSEDDDETNPFFVDPADDEEDAEPPSPIKISFPMGVSPPDLPQHTERIPVPRLNFLERVVASFTVYSEMERALSGCDGDFEKILSRLQAEWKFAAGLHVALAAGDMAVASISPDSLFAINSFARSAVAASSMASGLGLLCAAWFLVRYASVDVPTFVARAADIMSADTPSFFYFALSSRVPALLMLASATSLMLLLAFVAFRASPITALVACLLVGVLVGSQFLVCGILWVAQSVKELFTFLVRLVPRATEGP
ncbi:hypothetical protein B0H17DRAFT_501525 [Mycena rosella]|uniref:Uncharacterized protein n=1 Tax=Mycena rosella TaxID=1033263 RepID=A0AAD7DJS8_MYCRO|nr:hypothetical protein B0H17DRAFT_501525 [Mycena rosella]